MNILLEGGTRLQRGPKRNEPGLPLISIVTVTFNAVELFPDTLKTIRAQDYPNVEWIVIDGGSTDGTIDILHANQDVIDYWLSEPDRGMYDALAKGFEMANGEILCWLNAGDMFLNGALSIFARLQDNRLLYSAGVLQRFDRMRRLRQAVLRQIVALH